MIFLLSQEHVFQLPPSPLETIISHYNVKILIGFNDDESGADDESGPNGSMHEAQGSISTESDPRTQIAGASNL